MATADTSASATAIADYLQSLSNDKYDPILGEEIHQLLLTQGLENPMSPTGDYRPKAAVQEIINGIHAGLHKLGIDMADVSMRGTPQRYANMLVGELTRGLCYSLFPKCSYTVPPGDMDEMVLVDKIQVLSLCEHHLQTIDGYAHIAYIPNEKLLGLSKFARITEFFSRRPQVQERLTSQIYHALEYILKTPDIGVVIRATHYCMRARGTLQHASQTQTNKMGGRFLTKAALRAEFLDAIQ